MRPEAVGSLIGGVSGLVYVEVGAGALPSPAPAVLRVLALVAFLGLLAALVRVPCRSARRSPSAAPGASPPRPPAARRR